MRGPCAKRRVTCHITYGPDLDDFVIGENDCATPQAACPREIGEGYEKCKTICGQAGHAETEALRKAKESNINLRGATAYLRGHYWMCEPCGAALREAGVSFVTIIPSK
jgi:deoxycytidylate deaminase